MMQLDMPGIESVHLPSPNPNPNPNPIPNPNPNPPFLESRDSDEKVPDMISKATKAVFDSFGEGRIT